MQVFATPNQGKKSRTRSVPGTGSFESVKDQIGYCGIWCGSCVVDNGALGGTSRGYERTIRDHDVNEWGPKEVDCEAFLGDGH